MKIGDFQGIESGIVYSVTMNDNKIITVAKDGEMVGREPFDQSMNDLMLQVQDMIAGAEKKEQEDV